MAELSAAYKSMIWYASKKGWFVFPTRGKAPLTTNGLLDATIDPRLIKAWAERWPDAGVAIRTGAASGFFVLDVDPRHGGTESLTELEQKHSPMPSTVEAITGGGGRHLLFRHPGKPIKNTESYPAPGLDIRGDGGYICAAPSLHASGRKYEWEVSSRPDTVQLADAPEWFLALLAAPKDDARDGAAPIPELIYEQHRNATLTSLAGSMRRRAASESVILAALLEANKQCVPPLDDEEVQMIAHSVTRYDPARQEPDGINLWDTIVGDRFQGPPPPGDENWDEFAADLEVGAMIYRLANIPIRDLTPAFEAAYLAKSFAALKAAIVSFEQAARNG